MAHKRISLGSGFVQTSIMYRLKCDFHSLYMDSLFQQLIEVTKQRNNSSQTTKTYTFSTSGAITICNKWFKKLKTRKMKIIRKKEILILKSTMNNSSFC